jgi:hypothetical protein
MSKVSKYGKVSQSWCRGTVLDMIGNDSQPGELYFNVEELCSLLELSKIAAFAFLVPSFQKNVITVEQLCLLVERGCMIRQGLEAVRFYALRLSCV